ncbi:MAG: ATP-binding protein [Erythrobacter sp.]|uniref:ATP-binding protein n=1 Tax=Erythrobacter sp. TaxID=1042 RepID=UPI0032659AA2
MPFEPYDWFQRSITASTNSKLYTGNGVVVAIDAKTERELTSRVWSEADLAKLLEEVSKHSPEQIVVANQYFDERSKTETAKLAAALTRLPVTPAWQIDLAPEDVRELTEDTALATSEQLAPSSAWLAPKIAQHVTPTVIVFQTLWFRAPTFTPYAVQTNDGIVPGAANVLANKAKIPPRATFEIDLSYDPKSIPKLSAIDVLNQDFSPSELRNKKVVIGFTERLGRDTRQTPLDQYTSSATLVILAAQTLEDGPPIDLGWAPAFIVSIVAALFWVVFQRPYGRWIALATFAVITFSPFLLERYLVYQGTSQGVFLILIVGVAKFWQRGREAIQVYRSAAETKSQFLAQASHDLRQPIHAIGLLADRLSQTDLTQDQQEIISKISWSVDNARRMFRALLDIAAIESGTLQKEIGAVSVNELLAQVDSQNALAAEQANVDLRLVPCDLVIKTDRALIGTMLQNLVSNAIRYSPGGRVVVGCRREGAGLSLSVIDNGRGISSDELENVQKEFYRSVQRSNLTTVNKGLGLAIVNRLAGILGLRFELRSELGIGASARIHGLKIIPAAAKTIPLAKETRLPLSGVRVVLADDDEETLDSTRAVLDRWGCEVSSYTELPDTIPPCDIVLSDFDFGFAGTLAKRAETLERIQAKGSSLIIISGHHPEQIRELLPLHEGLILTKPLRAAQLRSALMSLRTTKSVS